jgi:hypothetical protein
VWLVKVTSGLYPGVFLACDTTFPFSLGQHIVTLLNGDLLMMCQEIIRLEFVTTKDAK